MKMLWFKRRQYPIRRDEYRRSLRRCCFDYFDKGKRPGEVAKLLNMKDRTVYRYFEDWKKLTHEIPFSHIKKLMKEKPEFSDYMIGMLAGYFGVSRDKVVLRMQKPWGLMQLLTARFPNVRIERARSKIERRLEAALRLILFAEHFGGKEPEVVKKEINRIIFHRHPDSKRDRR